MEAYARLLRMTLLVVAPLEPAISRYLPDFFIEGRSRADAIRADLTTLGVSPVPASVAVPAIADLSDAFGAAYVLQGSMLGGAVIKRALERDLRPDTRPTSYLDYLGSDLGQTWKSFTTRLDVYGQQAEAPAWSRVLRTAQDTFAAFDAALTEVTCESPLT